MSEQPVPEDPRVLLVEPQSSGGLWHYACSLTAALTSVGVRVGLATEFPYEQLAESVAVLPVLSIGRRDLSNGTLLSIYRLQRFGGKIWRLDRLLRSRGVDLIHLHGPLGKLDFVFLQYLKSRCVGLVYTAHNPRPRDGRNRWLDLARYRQFDRIIVLSRRGVEDLTADGIEPSKIRFIPHGNYTAFSSADSSRPQAKHELGLPENARVLLFFGAIAPYKGLDLLLGAFEQLATKSADLYLVIAGKPLQDFRPYEVRIRSRSLIHRVIADLRYVPMEEISKYFLAADVVVLPYKEAYQSGILHLAYGFGRPVVVTDVGELGEMVREDGTGVIANELTPEAIADGIKCILSNNSAAVTMGERGRVLAETKYSWRRIAEAHRKIYQELGSSREAPYGTGGADPAETRAGDSRDVGL